MTHTEYNPRIARMLGWTYKGPMECDIENEYPGWQETKGHELAFHSDYNQIMQAVDFIAKEYPYQRNTIDGKTFVYFGMGIDAPIETSGTDPLKVIYEAVCKVVEAKGLGLEGGNDG